jgi:hypothetical protein
MIKKSRSKVTNRPPANRPTRSATATGRRVRDLFTAYLERLGPGPHDPIVQAQALRAAELATICEGLRAKALAGEEVATAGITQMEGTAKRAEEALVKGVVASEPDPVQALHSFLRNPTLEDDADGE